MSQITTHVLDTSKGSPAAGVKVSLHLQVEDQWTELARSMTDADGRVSDLLKADVMLQSAVYKLRFETNDYFGKDHVATFYPFIEIVFDLEAATHYHVPLLLSPFGYTTYRGS